MKTFLSIVVLSLTAALVTPAFAQPKDKAECEKTKDMKWDDKAKKCVKK